MTRLCFAAAFIGLAVWGENREVAAAIRINEIFYAPEESEGRQFIELRSTTGGVESLANLWLLEIDGDSGAVPGRQDNPGKILTAINLGAAAIPSTGTNGLFLWRDSALVLDPSPSSVDGPDAATTVHVFDLFPGRPDLGYEGDENGGPKIFEDSVATFAIVSGFTGSVGMDLDTDNNSIKGDGEFDITPWTSVLDAVSFREPTDPGFQYAQALGSNFTNFQGFGDDVLSWDPVEEMWAFYDSGDGEGDTEYPEPFFANDGSWFFGSNDATFADGRMIHVAPDSQFLYVTPGIDNVSAVGGLYLGDVDYDGDVDADDIDLLYDNLGYFGTRWDAAKNAGRSNMTDVRALIEVQLGTKFGDADLDQDLDHDDYLAWRSGFAGDSGWAKGDFDGNDITDAVDFVLWRKFATAGGSSPSAPVGIPEPASVWLIAFVAACAPWARRQARLPREFNSACKTR